MSFAGHNHFTIVRETEPIDYAVIHQNGVITLAKMIYITPGPFLNIRDLGGLYNVYEFQEDHAKK